MSLRHLKKVFDSDDLLPATAASSEDEDTNILEPVPTGNKFNKSKKKKANQKERNKFELLAEVEMNGEPDNDGEVDNEHEAEADSADEEDSNKKTSKKKQRKKKKKKQPQESAENCYEPGSSRSTAGPSSRIMVQKAETGQDLEEFEFEISPEEREQVARRLKLEELFALDPKSLNPENELKKMFGSKVINHERGGSGGRFHNNFSSQHRRNLLSRRGRLVYPKEQRTLNGANGITLELQSTDDRTGYKTFKFNHSQGYRDLQKRFMAAVNSYNPDSIVNLMRNHPYHIDAHIQLSDMAKHSEDMQIASELVEDGINYLQNVFDHQFDVCSPACQLPYKYQENRALHILLFKYLIFLGQRGCPRTALQLCKKLLSLDQNRDSLGVTLMVDFYAIKSGEYSWLCDLYELWNVERNLDQLPNWAYSVALAHFLRRNDAVDAKQQSKSSGSKASTSATEEDIEAKSNELLQYALLMFPSVLVPLLEKCGIQSDSKVVNHWYFTSLISKKQTKALNLLCDLYVWRTHHLWRDSSILRWLEFNTQAVITKIDQDNKITNDFAQKRQRRYAGSPYNILRHVILTDSKDITIPLPAELSKKPILSFDPISPHDAVDIYDYRQPDPTRPAAAAGGANQGLLSMLFRSLVFDLNAMQGQAAEGRLVGGNGNELAQAARGLEGHEARLQLVQNAEQAAAAGENNNNAGLAGIQDSVHSLLTAMRDLLHVVTPGIGGDEPNNASGDENDEEEEAHENE